MTLRSLKKILPTSSASLASLYDFDTSLILQGLTQKITHLCNISEEEQLIEFVKIGDIFKEQINLNDIQFQNFQKRNPKFQKFKKKNIIFFNKIKKFQKI